MANIASWKDKKARVFGELVAILGEENVSQNLAVRVGYRLAGRLSPLGTLPHRPTHRTGPDAFESSSDDTMLLQCSIG